MFIGDFHIHSNFSDGELSIPEIIDIYGQQGIKAIAITDHITQENSFLGRAAHLLGKTLTKNNFQFYIKTIMHERERALKLYNMEVIPGAEITINHISNDRSFHILSLGITEYVSADQTIEEIVYNTRRQGGISVAAHPVHTRTLEKQTYYLWNNLERYRNTFDAWEVASGPRLYDEVLQETLPMIANSDFHSHDQFSSWKTVFECNCDQKSILMAIKKQDISFTFQKKLIPTSFHIKKARQLSGFFNVSSYVH